MRYKINRVTKRALHVLLFLASLYTAGCAVKPWTAPLNDVELLAATDTITHIIAAQDSCGKTIKGDISLVISHSLNKNGVAGYFQFTKPSSYKFIVSNTFDQPVLIVAGDQVSFQLINTISRSYLSGSIKSFGIRNKISPQILKGNWQEWITGSKIPPSQPVEIRNDLESNGIWATYRIANNAMEHLFFDPGQQKITRRLLETEGGKRWAEIEYSKWVVQDSCYQPSEIKIKELGFNVEISLEITDVSITDDPLEHKVSIPPGFSRTYLP